jgi:hypothetical protein
MKTRTAEAWVKEWEVISSWKKMLELRNCILQRESGIDAGPIQFSMELVLVPAAAVASGLPIGHVVLKVPIGIPEGHVAAMYSWASMNALAELSELRAIAKGAE